MKKTTTLGLIAITVVFSAFLISGCSTTQEQNTQPQNNQPSETGRENYDVAIQGFEFKSPDLIIKQGDSVTWINMDDVSHTIKFDFKESGLLSKGDSYSYIFNEKGTYKYICGIHPTMKGTVTVN